MSKLDTALSALKAVVNGMPDEVIDTHIRNILDRCEEAIKEIEDNEQDKTCVPVVPQATEEQRETLHQKAIGKHKETYERVEYEVMLRYQDTTELILDVRKDTVDLDEQPIEEEYVEGFVYDHHSLEQNYKDALKQYEKLLVKYRELAKKEENSSVNVWDEVEHDANRLIAIKKENYYD